jgi:phosphate transport system substrate-binding protein
MHLTKVSFLFFLLLGFFSCFSDEKKTKGNEDTINSGTINVSVDETLQPLMLAEFNVYAFQNQNAKLNVTFKPEREVFDDFKNDSARAIIVTRELTEDEMNYFKSIQYVPRSMPFAKDAISFIVNKNNPCDSFTLDELIKTIKGQSTTNSVIVFDNNGSSTLRWLKDSLLKKDALSKNCFALQNNPEVIKYVSENEKAIGIIGNSWISNLNDSLVIKRLHTIKRVKIAAINSRDFLEPYQSEIATNSYPLARMVYCIQRDGKVGLGTGLQRFLYDETGQLIALKFGLMPFRQPERSLHFNEQ